MGEFVPVLPLDALILKELPDEGTTFMGAYPEGKNVKDLGKVIGEGQIPSSVFGTRLRLLNMFGLVVHVKTVRGSTAVYQITAAGKKFLAQQAADQVVAVGRKLAQDSQEDTPSTEGEEHVGDDG